MLAHVADAVENAHFEVMMSNFRAFFLDPFSRALSWSLKKVQLDLKEFMVSYGTVFAWVRGLESGNKLN